METPRKIKDSRPNCTTPTLQNLSYRETFHFGSESLHRSFTYNKLWSPGKNGDGTTITQLTVSCCKTPSIPSQQTKRKKLTYDKLSSKKLKTCSGSKFKFEIMLTIGLIGAVAIWAGYKAQCGDRLMESGFNEKLETSIFGQETAVGVIKRSIQEAKYESDDKKHTMLVFAGPTGVGKSYASSIIKDYFPNKNSIVSISAQELIVKQTLSPVSFCWSLQIIEDCDADNFLEVLKVVKSIKPSPKTLVIINLSSNETWYPSGRWLSVIFFAPLTVDTVTKCFIRELEQYSYKLNYRELSKLVEDHMQFGNEVGNSPGCKLVNERIIKYFAENGIVP